MKQNDTKKRSFRFDRDEASDDGSYSNPTHYHDQYEIYYITRGSCVYFISDRSYRLRVGDLILIPEGIIHHTVYQNRGHERLLINCSRKFIPAAFRPQGYLYRNSEITEQIRGILEEIEQEWERGDRFSEDAILCLMRLMCYLILRHPNQYETSDGENSTVSRAAEYLQGHFDRDLTLEEVAAEIPVSAAHLSRLFKKETGFGFSGISWPDPSAKGGGAPEDLRGPERGRDCGTVRLFRQQLLQHQVQAGLRLFSEKASKRSARLKKTQFTDSSSVLWDCTKIFPTIL